jgi:hypothetical protein
MKRFNEQGQDVIEYVLLVAFMAIAGFVLVPDFIGLWENSQTVLEAAKMGPPVTMEGLERRIEAQDQEIDTLRKNLSDLYEDVESDPTFVLRQIDRSLDALERGDNKAIRGSYSDWFAPKMYDLRQAGIPKWRLARRISRLVYYASQGKYFSSSVQRYVESDGIEKFRQSAYALLD